MSVPFVHLRQFLSDTECRQARAAFDRGSIEAAEVLADDIVLDRSYRDALYVNVDRATRAAVERRLDGVRRSLDAALQCRLGKREGVGFLRYRAGGFYRPHRDRGENPSWPGAAQRVVSVIVFLNTAGVDFAGGTLRLLEPRPRDIVPIAGSLVAFPSTSLHEVLPVTQGVRDVIVDWFYGPTVNPDR